MSAKSGYLLEMLAESQDGAFAVDASHRILWANRAAERILGYRPEEMLGRACYQLLVGLSQEDVRVCAPGCGAMLSAKQARVPPCQTILVRIRQGSPRWLSFTHLPQPGARPQLKMLLHIFHDVTEEMEARRLLQRLSGLLCGAPLLPTLANFSLPVGPTGASALTMRELEVLRLLACGSGTREIAEKLALSPTTVRNHVQRILSKLSAHSRLEAVADASRQGIL